MGPLPEEKAPPDEAARQDSSPEGGVRWLNVLEEVVDEQETGLKWWQRLGISLAWAAGFALAALLAATVILGLVELFKAGRQFTAMTLSDYFFWASALLMLAGFLVPTSGNLGGTRGKKDGNESEGRETRSTRALRNRMRRMYDPWRWRLWVSALLAFGITMLIGLAAKP
jgi:hypothetical protein